MTHTIDVYGDWVPGQQPFKIGTMVIDRVRGKESFSFTDDVDWLSQPGALTLDPDLQLYQGLWFPPNSKQGNFGVFLNSSPDR
jgi:hypothetical protein